MSQESRSVADDRTIPETFSATKKLALTSLPKIRERVEKLNRRAEYLGCPAITLTHEESIR
jgi:hypothetical protein